MNLRKTATVLAVTGASLLAVPVGAGAKTPAHPPAKPVHRATQSASQPVKVTSFKSIPMTGTAKNGKSFTGHLNVSQFVTRGGRTFALGTLTGKIANRSVKPTQVAVPVSMKSVAAGTASTAAACQILNLVLGPLHLNLLGLHVNLNQVVLNITGATGAGQLLGNLLCGIANLLNPATGALPTGSTLTGLLNIVQQLTNTPGLLGL